jgi:hypothetical protein
VLDLAPEAPWRCPDDCPKFEVRLADVGWVRGTLVSPAIEPEPNVDPVVAAQLLDDAENVINAAGPSILAEVERERDRTRPSGGARGAGMFDRLRGRFRRPR